MQVTIEVPDDIAQAVSSGTSREALAQQFSFSEMEARYYQRIIKEHRRPQFPATLLLPDIHCPYHDEPALGLAIDYGRSLNPETVVLLGDFADFYKVSHWRKDPVRMPFKDEIRLCRDLLARITREFPHARKVYLEGNHEMRLQNFLWSQAPELAGLEALTMPGLLDLDKLGWEYIVSRDRLNNMQPAFRIGKLHVVHGHEVRVGAGAVNLARLYYLKTLVNVLVAHHHQSQQYLVKKMNHQHEGGWVAGCLCSLSPEFAPVTNWNHGFTVVYLDDDGDFCVRNRQIINGKIL